MIETQHTVAAWAHATFGSPSPMRAATRMNEEVAELLARLASYPGDSPNATEAIREEVADVQIVLYVLADALGMDLSSRVNAKMTINRARKWKLDGSGCGQHED
jgi:NTP pyrophosphatase (non-canonical NTP hydrolase)